MFAILESNSKFILIYELKFIWYSSTYIIKNINNIKKEYPKEGCGLLGVVKGKLEWFPCKNISTGTQEFIFDSREYLKIAQRCDIVATVHSHPDARKI